jgi:hypothetical protein
MVIFFVFDTLKSLNVMIRRRVNHPPIHLQTVNRRNHSETRGVRHRFQAN